MSDRDTLIALLDKMGLKPTDQVHTGSCEYYQMASKSGDGTEVHVGEGDGYSGFFAVFRFDADGNVTGHGIWE